MILEINVQENSTEDKSMSLQNFNHIGEELRRAIDAIYTKLPITEKPSIALPTVGKDPASVDIATLVQTFIPMGTPFVEAEQMLVSAGFTVDTHEPNPFLEDSDPRKNSVTFMPKLFAVK